MTLIELFWTQAWSGSPLYVLACLAQGLWLHQRAGLGLSGLIATGCLSTLLTILAGVVLWGRLFAGESIMLWQAVNLPALCACALIYPIITVLVQFGFTEKT